MFAASGMALFVLRSWNGLVIKIPLDWILTHSCNFIVIALVTAIHLIHYSHSGFRLRAQKGVNKSIKNEFCQSLHFRIYLYLYFALEKMADAI